MVLKIIFLKVAQRIKPHCLIYFIWQKKAWIDIWSDIPGWKDTPCNISIVLRQSLASFSWTKKYLQPKSQTLYFCKTYTAGDIHSGSFVFYLVLWGYLDSFKLQLKFIQRPCSLASKIYESDLSNDVLYILACQDAVKIFWERSDSYLFGARSPRLW